MQLTATATYNNGTSSQITSSVTWMPDDTSTAKVTPAGLLSGVEASTTTVTATKDGITSNTVNVDVCLEISSTCIDIFDIGGGKLFTNSPSVPYLDSIGGSATNSSVAEYNSSFYRMNWSNANNLCSTYRTQNVGGRNNWRLATRSELQGLVSVYGNMSTARGWPLKTLYWTSTPVGSLYHYVSLGNGSTQGHYSSTQNYVSCVSVP